MACGGPRAPVCLQRPACSGLRSTVSCPGRRSAGRTGTRSNIESRNANGPQVGGSLTRWHAHLTVCDAGRPTIAGFGVQLRGTCNPSTWTDRYTEQMLHVWVVPYPGGPFSDDLSRGATNAAVRAVLAR